jgi:hypothetical protein
MTISKRRLSYVGTKEASARHAVKDARQVRCFRDYWFSRILWDLRVCEHAAAFVGCETGRNCPNPDLPDA